MTQLGHVPFVSLANRNNPVIVIPMYVLIPSSHRHACITIQRLIKKNSVILYGTFLSRYLICFYFCYNSEKMYRQILEITITYNFLIYIPKNNINNNVPMESQQRTIELDILYTHK